MKPIIKGKHINFRATPESMSALNELVFHPQFLGDTMTDVINGSLVFTHNSLTGGNAIITYSVRPIDVDSIVFTMVSVAEDLLLFSKVRNCPGLSSGDGIGLVRTLEKNAGKRLLATMVTVSRLFDQFGAKQNLNPMLLRESADRLISWRETAKKKLGEETKTGPDQTRYHRIIEESVRMHVFLSELGIIKEPSNVAEQVLPQPPTLLKERISPAQLEKILPATRAFLAAIQKYITIFPSGSSADKTLEFMKMAIAAVDYMDLVARACRLMKQRPHLVSNQGPSLLRETQIIARDWFYLQPPQTQSRNRAHVEICHIQAAHILHFYSLVGLGESSDFLCGNPKF